MSFILLFLSLLVSIALPVAHTGHRAGRHDDKIIRSPTHGQPASKFVSGCEIYLFGEYLQPVEGPNGEMGFLIEKTDSVVTLNGRHFFSPHDPPWTPVRPPSEKAKRHAEIFEEVLAEVRRLAVAHPTLEKAYFVDSVLYTDEPKPHVTESGDTVMLRFSKSWAHYRYEDTNTSFPLTLKPVLPREEREAQALDAAYQGLAAIRPGFIILIGEGCQSWKPLSEAPTLKAALAKIPALAERRYQNMYGEWVYDGLTIDGYHFGPSIVADFTEK